MVLKHQLNNGTSSSSNGNSSEQRHKDRLIRMTSGASSHSPPFGSLSSSSSIETADSDHSYTTAPTSTNIDKHQQQQQQQRSQRQQQLDRSNKSPVLIKYNYYDQSGTRHEQENLDVNFSKQTQQTKLSLSPSFRQNLDQIVRNRHDEMQQRIQSTSPINGANNIEPIQSPVSPSSSSSSGCIADGSTTANELSGNGISSNNNGNPVVWELARRYKWSSYEQRCLRCHKTVYQMDKVGPLKDFTFYHQNCFKCLECGTKLTLKTYFNNQHSHEDKEVYCHRHCPKTPAGKLDNQSVGIRAALNAPKVFDPMCSAATIMNCAGGQPEFSYHNHINCCPQQYHNNGTGGPMSPNHRCALSADADAMAHPMVDAQALHIQHAVRQTRLLHAIQSRPARAAGMVMVSSSHQGNSGNPPAHVAAALDDTKLSQFINGRLEYLEPKQKLLEAQHREEEEALFKAFEKKWRDEERRISEQIRSEWQEELTKLLQRYEQQLNNHLSMVKSNGTGDTVAATHLRQQQQQQQKQLKLHQQNLVKKVPVGTQTSSAAQPSSGQANLADAATSEQQQRIIEFERANLEKCMTIKLDRKKETLKRKLRETERQATAELVEKQSREMLSLISMKLEEYKEEQKRKIGADLEQFEAIEALANQLGSSLQLAYGNGNQIKGQSTTIDDSLNGLSATESSSAQTVASQQTRSSAAASQTRPSSAKGGLAAQPPPPMAPKISKMQLYNSERADEVFHDIDRLAINVAREDQQTFTDLVHHLTRNCLTDVEKVRAIFRWITVKNLNTMQFDSSIKADTPLGLLRGIKQGSESYHVLFKRLCSYAGLHCVVIKGYSKSAGYQPGVKFEGNRFRNSWNAVYVAGAWRFVQCNWGARHLVSVAVMQDKNNNNTRHQPKASGDLAMMLHTGGSGKPPVGRAAGGSSIIDRTGSSSKHMSSPSNDGGRRAASSATGSSRSSAGKNNSKTSSSSASSSPSSPPAIMHVHQHLAAAASGIAGSTHSGDGNHGVQSVITTSSTRSSGSSSSAASTGSLSQPATSASNHQQHQHQHRTRRIHGEGIRSSATAAAASDSLRYEYDDHYFLTDPDEFIYEFYPLSSEWQLLRSRPITIQEFEQLPFVRSLFFKYGLYFVQRDIKSVLYTDSSGATTIKIGMPTHMVPSLIFHYNLKHFDSDSEQYDGISLKRFVMQSVESGDNSHCDNGNGLQALLSNIVSFRVHVPENGSYILDIFANSTTATQYITGEPMKFKSVCKFKIVANNLKTVMIPLPDCASGEYGPMKATRLFGIIPLTHENGLISVSNEKRCLDLQFRMTRPLLDFMASLHKNNCDERHLSKSIKIFIDGDIVYINVRFPEDGQYGLDIYTRDETSAIDSKTSQASSSEIAATKQPKKHLLTHCCKYLINVRHSNSNQTSKASQ